ncbi:MAG: YbaK/EbsC family protein [Actinomycetales bacterium]
MRQHDDVTPRPALGTLDLQPALDRPDLLALPTAEALRQWSRGGQTWVAEIDAEVADTAAFTAAYDVPAEASANCVVIGGRRGGDERVAACLVLATTRADVNGLAKRQLDVRKASFLPMDQAVADSGMAYGGITPLGLPQDWPVFVDARVVEQPWVVIGSGTRTGKLAIPGVAAAELPGAVVLEGLGL